VEFRTSTHINAPIGRVWEILTDVEHWPEWTRSMSTVKRLDPGPLTIGSRARITQPKLPTVVWQVTELTPLQSFSWTARGLGITSVADHRLTNTDGSTDVTLVFRQTGPLSAVLRLISGELTRRYMEMEAQGLKRRSEF
jgi:uncharacterized protein YndB with AHSA1/START domain